MGQHQRSGLEEGAEVSAACPSSEGDLLGTENRSRVDKPDYFPRFLEEGGNGEFEYDALQTPGPEGDPNGMTGSQVQVEGTE